MERQQTANLTKANSTSHNNQAKAAPQKLTPFHPVLQLQQKIGNQAVTRLLNSGGIQTKLSISHPDDPYEREADHVADAVMRMAEPQGAEGEARHPLATQITPLVHRMPTQPVTKAPNTTVAPNPPIQRVPVAVREDDDEEKNVAPKFEPGVEFQEEEKPVQTKLATDAAIQRQTNEDEEGEEEPLQSMPPIQRRMEEEDEQALQTKPLPGGVIQRLCTECEGAKQREEGKPAEMVQRRSTRSQLYDNQDEEEQQVQAKGGDSATPSVTPSVAANIHSLNHGGSPLPQATRAFFEPRFGADFSQVRIHTDPRAAETAKSINARAFTVDRNIAFGEGQYAPESQGGRRLLAHELTHVVQQNSSQLQRTHGQHLLGHELTHVVQQGFTSQSTSIQRDEEPSKATQGTVDSEEKDVLQTISEIEANWTQVKDLASSFNDLASWIEEGDAVITLIPVHSLSALDAKRAGDMDLYKTYVQVVESDKIMYDFIAWHVFYYSNLLLLEPQLYDSADSFDADDREFSGRDKAEEILSQLQELIEKEIEREPLQLEQVSTSQEITVKRQNAVIASIIGTSAFNSEKLFVQQTVQIQQLEQSVELLVQELNKFFATATKEGFKQAGDALIEYIQARGGRRGRRPKFTSKKIKPRTRKKSRGRRKRKQEDPEKIRSGIRRLLRSPFLRRGPYAGGSIPASFPEKYTAPEQQAINKLGNTYGDHHTGVRQPGTVTGNWTPDHQPVSELVGMALKDRELKSMMDSARMPTNLNNQRLFPHSLNSGRIQGGVVRGIQLKLQKLARIKRTR